MTKRLSVLCALCVLMLTSCAPVQAAPTPHIPDFNLVTVAPHSTSTPTPFQPSTPTNTSIPSATSLPINTIVPIDTATSTALPPTNTLAVSNSPSPTPAPANTRTQYTFFVNLKYSAHTLHTDETIKYTNTTGQTLSNVVLAVVPNLSSNCFSLDSVTQDGQGVTNYTLNGQRLTINLSQPLAPNAVTTFILSFDLSLPPRSGEKPFGYPG